MDSAPSTFVIPVNGIAEGSDGGQAPAASANDGGRLSGVPPQPPQSTTILRCTLCGSTEICWTAWVSANSREVVGYDTPSDDTWCPDCREYDGGVTEDYGHGFVLWLDAERSGEFATFAEALAEAKQSDHDHEIEPIYKSQEVTR